MDSPIWADDKTKVKSGISRIHSGLTFIRTVSEQYDDAVFKKLVGDTEVAILKQVRAIRKHLNIPYSA